MKAVISSFLTVALAAMTSAADPRYESNDPIAGTYYGSLINSDQVASPLEAQIRSLGNSKYDGIVIWKRLKGDVTEFGTISKITEFEYTGEETSFFAGYPFEVIDEPSETMEDMKLVRFELSGKISATGITAEPRSWPFREGEATVKLVRSSPKLSPTLGAKPPSDAIVLFDGKAGDEWKDMTWEVKDGALEVGEGNITTKTPMENALLHIEFRTPIMPEARGQARGNSGVYIRSVFEVQVLDSFGKFPLETNDAGGIYKVAAPDWRMGNASLPPGTWQTYDITFREGSREENRLPRLSVVHNGKIVVNNAEIPGSIVVNGTGGGDVDGGFLMLQDHGDAVQFRNIWVQPID